MGVKQVDQREKIAIIDWTHLVEDYLDNIQVSFEQFKNEMKGGWLFGYIEALQSAGYEPVFFCFSAHENHWGNHYHTPTDSEICVLPSPAIYRRLRKTILNPYAEYVEQACINLNAFNRPFYSLLLSSAEYLSTPLLKLHREFKRLGITKVICQEYESGRFDEIALLVKLSRINVYATFQGGIESQNRTKTFIRRLAINNSNGIMCGSSREVERIRKRYGLFGGKIGKIFNPVSFDVNQNTNRVAARKKYRISQNARVAVWHGRIDLKRKGLDLIVKAWQKLNEKSYPFECLLLFLGHGNEAEEFDRLLDKTKAPNIKWFSEFSNDREKLVEFLSLGNVYIFASRHEGFPVAPIEAMSIGLPLLATNVSGISDILADGEKSGGIVVDLEDVAAIAETLERLFLDEILCQKLGEHAKQRVRSAFSIEQVGEQIREFLNINAK